jgi:hypothetical protein
LPQLLSQTGLYEDITAERIAPSALSYRPRFELWSDGASKKRWISIPAGRAIDTSDMDNWVFPEGTQLWKEFASDEGPIETRYFVKRESEWLAQSYKWDPAAKDGFAEPYGFENASAVGHDIPAALECHACHGGRRSFVLGFSAIQLAYDAQTGLSLRQLEDAELLSEPPQRFPEVPGAPETVAALGVLHANCAHCHNSDSARPPCFHPGNRLDFWLPAGAATVEELPTAKTGIPFAIRPGNASESLVVERMQTRDFIYRMPPLGSERIDYDGVQKVRQWIDSM